MHQLEETLNSLTIANSPNAKNPKQIYNTLNNELNRIRRRRNILLVDDTPEPNAFNKVRAVLGQGKNK